MRITTLLAFAAGAAAVYCLMDKQKAAVGPAASAPTDPRDFHPATTGSPVPQSGDPDLVGS